MSFIAPGYTQPSTSPSTHLSTTSTSSQVRKSAGSPWQNHIVAGGTLLALVNTIANYRLGKREEAVKSFLMLGFSFFAFCTIKVLSRENAELNKKEKEQPQNTPHATITALNQQVKIRQNKILTLEESLQNKESELKSANEKLGAASKKLSQVKLELTTETNNSKTLLETQLNYQTNLKQEHATAISNLNEEISGLRNEIIVHKDEIESLKEKEKELAKLQELNKNLTSEINAIGLEKLKIETSLQENEEAIKTVNVENANLTSKVKELESQVLAAKQKIEDYLSDKEQAECALTQEQETSHERMQEIVELKDNFEKISEENVKLTAEIENLNKKAEKIAGEMEIHFEQIKEGFERELYLKDKQITQLEASLQAVRKPNKTLSLKSKNQDSSFQQKPAQDTIMGDIDMLNDFNPKDSAVENKEALHIEEKILNSDGQDPQADQLPLDTEIRN